jgi:hypothetical protein
MATAIENPRLKREFDGSNVLSDRVLPILPSTIIPQENKLYRVFQVRTDSDNFLIFGDSSTDYLTALAQFFEEYGAATLEANTTEKYTLVGRGFVAVDRTSRDCDFFNEEGKMPIDEFHLSNALPNYPTHRFAVATREDSLCYIETGPHQSPKDRFYAEVDGSFNHPKCYRTTSAIRRRLIAPKEEIKALEAAA